jgi:HK97 family phage portal protein
MGFITKTIGRLGFGNKQSSTKGIDITSGELGGILSGNSGAPNFTSYNSLRQQMGSYSDWVYAAASRIAEECSTIDINLYKNNTKSKSATIGRKLSAKPSLARKYLRTPVGTNRVYTDGGVVRVMRASTPKLEEIDDHPLIDLLDNPNKFMSGIELLEMTYLHLELTGNSFWAMFKGKDNRPAELWPLYPNYIRIVPDEKEFIKGYVYTINGQQIPFEPDEILHIKYSNPTDLRWGISPVRAAARAVDTDTMAADYNRKFFFNSAQPDAVLYTDEMIDDKTWLRIKDQFQDMYGGVANAHKTAILENGLKYQAMNPNQREMEFLKSREFNRDMILAIFGIPKSVLGMDASMSRANAETAEYVFAKGTLRPKFIRLVNAIQNYLVPLFGDNTVVVGYTDPVPEDREYKLSERKELANTVLTVNEIREEMGLEPVEAGNQLYIAGTMRPLGEPIATSTTTEPVIPTDEETEDEDMFDDGGDSSSDTPEGGDSGETTNDTSAGTEAVKAIHSKSPLPIPEGYTRCNCCAGYGEHHVTGFECYRCDAGGSVTDEENKQPIPCNGREDSPNIWIDDDGDYRHAEEKGVKAKKKDANADDTEEIAPSAYLDQRNEIADEYEPKMFKAIVSHMKQQEKEVLANIDKRLKSLHKGQQKRVIKANLSDLFNAEASQEGWSMRLGVLFEKIISTMGLLTWQQLEDATGQSLPPFEPITPESKSWYEDRIRRVSVYFDQETQKQLGATLMEGIDAGESVDELRKRVKTVYAATQEGDLMWYRSERIARTEPIFATTWSTIDGWKRSGLVVGKRWRTAPSAVPAKNNPCGFCRSMNDRIVELNANYYDKGDTITYEDDNGELQSRKLDYVDTIGPPMHCNCRCTLLPVLAGEV